MTAFAGIIKVVVALDALAKVTPSALVHLSNTLPVAGAFAVIVTVIPSAKLPEPVPFSTVTTWAIGAALIVYVSEATELFVMPSLTAIALIVVVVLTLIAAL